MLKDSLITQSEYDRLKENLLFSSGFKIEPEQIVVNVTESKLHQISKPEYLKLKSKYEANKSAGSSAIIGGVIMGVCGAGFIITEKLIGDNKPVKIIGWTLLVAHFPITIFGATRMGSSKGKLRDLKDDYQIIAETKP